MQICNLQIHFKFWLETFSEQMTVEFSSIENQPFTENFSPLIVLSFLEGQKHYINYVGILGGPWLLTRGVGFAS